MPQRTRTEQFHQQISDRFGVLDDKGPSLFKERLFVHLSRFCPIRYCIVRHVGVLMGLGRLVKPVDRRALTDLPANLLNSK